MLLPSLLVIIVATFSLQRCASDGCLVWQVRAGGVQEELGHARGVEEAHGQGDAGARRRAAAHEEPGLRRLRLGHRPAASVRRPAGAAFPTLRPARRRPRAAVDGQQGRRPVPDQVCNRFTSILPFTFLLLKIEEVPPFFLFPPENCVAFEWYLMRSLFRFSVLGLIGTRLKRPSGQVISWVTWISKSLHGETI